jgi:hypothetical protein
MDRGYLNVTAATSAGVIASVCVIDNVTNDPTTIAMVK